MRSYLLSAALLGCALADKPEDLVTQLPGFPAAPFKVYSGYLEVNGPIAGYDKLMIHYQFDQSQNDPSKDPVVAWHTGGPGGSSLYGQYAEMGYFQVSSSGQYVNEFAWNRIANMLYLESPAGSFLSPSNLHSGFSYCEKNGEIQKTCHWNDTSQAEAYGHTLLAFYAAFPEFAQNDFFLTGESYAGQYVPNIANFLITSPLTTSINLKGIAVGNGCWGGDATSVNCNGPNADRNDVEFYYGKGLISKILYTKLQKTCKFDEAVYTRSVACDVLLVEMNTAVGPHNVYNVYDNCPGAAVDTTNLLEVKRSMRDNMPEGGYDWTCGQFDAVPKYILRDDVKEALHMKATAPSSFGYTQSGPASVTLYPSLAKKLRVLIYNGDADTCVPFNGNEEWTSGLADAGVLSVNKAWHPWSQPDESIPTGYATVYNVTAAPVNDFSFVTIRLAGHEVPNYRPKASFYMIQKFLKRESF